MFDKNLPQNVEEGNTEAPSYLPVIPENIPSDLKERRQFVVWRYVWDDKRKAWTKPPFQVSGRYASTDNPATWTTFGEAMKAVNTGRFNGIGFVMTDDDPYVGFDFDHCVDDAGGINPQAREYLDALNSYTEFSPSGHGLRVFVKASVRVNNRVGNNEAYSYGHYLTLTGHRLPNFPVNIYERDGQANTVVKSILALNEAAVEAPHTAAEQPVPTSVLDDDTLLDMARKAKNGDKFRRLFDEGAWQTDFPSQSEADLALCSMLAFWTRKDTGVMDRLFRRSALFRPKWDEARGDQTYGELTIAKAVEAATEVYEGGKAPRAAEDPPPPVKACFPRVPFPLDVFPPDLEASLRNMARAFGVDTGMLPGIVLCAVGAAVGRTVEVYVKDDWREPLIFWHGLVAQSGGVKSPVLNALTQAVFARQARDYDTWKTLHNAWKALPKKERQIHPEPELRFRVLTDLTLEGLRPHVEAGHGGVLYVQDELSAVVTGLNQYKSGGNDREAWLRLFDGKPAAVTRVGGNTFIKGARLNLCGGIQPAVLRATFKGLFLRDGTLFRYLLTYVPPTCRDIDGTEWTEENRNAWNALLYRLMDWSDKQDPDRPHQMAFSQEARRAFIDWRNEMHAYAIDLPEILRGFVPKAIGYAVRIAGALRIIHDTYTCDQVKLSRVMDLEDLNRAKRVVMYYLGQAEVITGLLAKSDAEAGEVSERTMRLAEVLAVLKPEVENGHLAVGYVMDRFNASVQEHERFKTARAFGAFLRACKLPVSSARYNVNGRRGVRCLVWNDAVEAFLADHRKAKGFSDRMKNEIPCGQSPPSPPSPLSKQTCGFADKDKVRQSPPSPLSKQSCGFASFSTEDRADFIEGQSEISVGAAKGQIQESRMNATKADLADFENQCPPPESRMNATKADKADMADIVSGQSEISPVEEKAHTCDQVCDGDKPKERMDIVAELKEIFGDEFDAFFPANGINTGGPKTCK